MQKQHIAFALAVSLLLTAICSAPNTAADILLKAVGKNEISLRPKTMDSQIVIHGQIAQIQTTLTMASELDIQSEADFEYTVPDNTLVTYFAYWYKGKKVVARIVTKERAAEIYRIVSNREGRRHAPKGDPALVEMKDKNTFHVRIFPIEANADLKVEIHSVQLLDADAKGSLFTFPLKAPEKNKGTLEKIHLHLQLYPDSDVTGISNNYNLPLIRDNNIQTLDLQQQNWRAPQDLKVRFSRPVKALNASLYSAKAGGTDGFFALALTPSQDIPKPRLEIQGIKTSQLLPAKLAPMKAHQPMLVTGRYSGNGAAKVLLHGYGKNSILTGTAKVLFSSQTAQPNAAAQFWAKLQMQQLESNAKNKSAAIQLSQRFNLPGKYTSWLALPEEGRKIYEKNKRDASKEQALYEAPRRWAALVMQGKGNTQAAKQLHDSFVIKAKEAGENPGQIINWQLYWVIQDAVNTLDNEAGKSHPDTDRIHKTQRYLNMLLSYIPSGQEEYQNKVRLEIKGANVKPNLTEYVSLVEAGKENSAQAKSLHKRLQSLYGQLNEDYSKTGNGDTNHFDLGYDLAGIASHRMEKLVDDWAVDAMDHGKNSRTQHQYFKALRLQKIVTAYSGPTYEFQYTRNYAMRRRLNSQLPKPNTRENIDYKAAIQKLELSSKTLAHNLQMSDQDREANLFASAQSLIDPIAQKYFSYMDDPVKNQEQMNLLHSQLNDVANTLNVSFDNLVNKYARSWAKEKRYYGSNGPSLPFQIAEEKVKKDPDLEKIKNLEVMLDKAIRILNYQPEKYKNILGYYSFGSPQTTHEAVSYALDQILSPRINRYQTELKSDKSLKHQDTEYQAYLENEIETLRNKFLTEKINSPYAFYYSPLYGIRDLLLREYRKENPDQARVGELREKLVELEKSDDYLTSSWTRARKITNPTLYGNLRAQRLELRANREKVEDKIKSESDPAQLKSLNDQRATIMAQQKKLIARMGDPLISVQAPDAVSVVALMPDGQTKQLIFHVQKNRWEARFDIPASAAEGEYTIQIIVARKGGSRQMLAMHYSVDLTPPAGNAQMKVIDKNYSGQKVLRLEVQTDDNAARVSALLPWNAKVELMPSENTSNQFFALTPVPDSYGKSTFPVTFVLTDKAHNRAEITVSNK